MAERYVGQIEYGASGTTTLDIDDVDSGEWIGKPPATGGMVILGSREPDEWLVGVILLDGPRAWQYATATRVLERRDDGCYLEFRGLEPFAPIADAAQLADAQTRFGRWQRWHSRVRMMLPDQELPPFYDVRLSVLDREPRPGDELPEHRSHVMQPVEPGSSRLAIDHDGFRIWLARGVEPDQIHCFHEGGSGGGSCTFPRSNLTNHGMCQFSGESHGGGGAEAHIDGIVDDRIIAVRVNGAHAVMGENVFHLAPEVLVPIDVITLTTAERDYELHFGPPPGL